MDKQEYFNYMFDDAGQVFGIKVLEIICEEHDKEIVYCLCGTDITTDIMDIRIGYDFVCTKCGRLYSVEAILIAPNEPIGDILGEIIERRMENIND